MGEKRVVPDYISLYPWTKQMAPFAGATRPLCDRKEVTLSDQMHAIAKFCLYTSTHIASKFTGGITDDYTSEFDPFSPQFGEKFSPPDMPVAVKDWSGAEISRVYADQWGAYNGMTYSTWEVNPPNPTGYAPTMMVFCMNDPGPILDTRQTVLSSTGTAIANPTLGQMVTDPLFMQGYSQFCYELPFMPGTTQYLDTPVVPTSAFAGAGYNNVDCSYPDATPAVKEVDGDGIGPWVAAAGHTLAIDALGDQVVPNYAYAGPSATTTPYNQKTVSRHYGFGRGSGTTGSVTIGGVAATVTGWSDRRSRSRYLPGCRRARFSSRRSQYGGSAAQCGELVITTAATTSGTGSVTGVTVTSGGSLYPGRYVSFTGAEVEPARRHANTAAAGVTGSVYCGGGEQWRNGLTANFTVTFSPIPAAPGTAAHGTAVVRRKVTGMTITTDHAPYTAGKGLGGAGVAVERRGARPALVSSDTSPGTGPGTGTVTASHHQSGQLHEQRQHDHRAVRGWRVLEREQDAGNGHAHRVRFVGDDDRRGQLGRLRLHERAHGVHRRKKHRGSGTVTLEDRRGGHVTVPTAAPGTRARPR